MTAYTRFEGQTMNRYERIGVFLTGSPADEVALGFAGRFATLAESQRVWCVHVEGGCEEPVQHDEQINRASLEKWLGTNWPADVVAKTSIEMHDDSGIAAMLRITRDDELDLIVVGRRLPSHQMGIGSAFTRLARKAPCDVLVVPNFAHTHFARLLVPVDMSEHSRMSLDTALSIARSCGEPHPQITVHVVYSVGYGYKKSGLTLQAAAENLERVRREQLGAFLANVDTTGVSFETVYTGSEQVAESVRNLASASNMDLIVIGSRGRSRAATAILGGTAEQILLGSAKPVLIVKKKGETVGLLNALLDGA